MKQFVFILTLICAAFGLSAQEAMKTLLSDMSPRVDSLFWGIDRGTRLDMIDYFEAGQPAFSNADNFKSPVRIGALGDRNVSFETTSPVSVEAFLITPGTDSLMVFAVTTPIDNNDVIVYVRDVRTGASLGYISPDYTDWLVPGAVDRVPVQRLLTHVPFVTSTAAVDTAAGTVTLTNTSVTVPGLDPDVKVAFLPAMTWRWNGKKFVISK